MDLVFGTSYHAWWKTLSLVLVTKHPKVCLGFSHGHITAVAPVLVCMRWMAQSFRSRMEGRVWGSYWWKGDLMTWQSVEKKNQKSMQIFHYLWKSECATSAFSQQVLSLKHSYHAFAISELDIVSGKSLDQLAIEWDFLENLKLPKELWKWPIPSLIAVLQHFWSSVQLSSCKTFLGLMMLY